MSLNSPPIQNAIAGPNGQAPQVWKLWFNDVYNYTNSLSGGGGGSSTWGSITGTLSSQIDLQNALNLKSNTTHTHVAADIAGVNCGQYEVDFGASETSSVVDTVSAIWVSTDTKLVASIAYESTTDHDPDDAMAEGIICSAGNIVHGVGFDICLSAPNGTWGKYKVNIIGLEV